ncbi:MAG: nucleotidyltransferase domain-containing protein [Desulfobacteraceae bacterium]|nr:nucleotidyltransferase domain-containing protein [Desulfobacteraceae bacterium]
MDGIDEKIRDYFQHKEEVASVYLFGSRAAGRERAASDVDIAVLLRRQHLSSARTLCEQYIVELGRILKKDIHPVIMNHAGEFVLKQILSGGRRILVSDPYFDACFTMISISRIMDFNFYLKQMQQGMRKKILES